MLECSFASFSTAGGTPFVNPFRVIWDSRRFAATPRLWGRISLDFPGFSRPDRDVSMGHTSFQ